MNVKLRIRYLAYTVVLASQLTETAIYNEMIYASARPDKTVLLLKMPQTQKIHSPSKQIMTDSYFI